MALDKAKSMDLDLVEVSPNTDPPVCRMMNFGKYIFELNKKAQSNKKKQRQAQVKEIKFRPNTESGDYQIKLRKLIAFLDEGDKAKVTLRFRGREFEHKDIGFALMQRIKADLVEFSQIEQEPQFEGRQMVMVFGPKK
jgi:translation initiation factor IF-3